MYFIPESIGCGDKKKRLTIGVYAYIVWKQQGFVCKSNTLKAQDVCLVTERNMCQFEIHPNETPEAVVMYVYWENIYMCANIV